MCGWYTRLRNRVGELVAAVVIMVNFSVTWKYAREAGPSHGFIDASVEPLNAVAQNGEQRGLAIK